MRRANFLLRVLKAHIEGPSATCPYCGQESTVVVGRKRVVLQLRKCTGCNLMFRWPKETTEFSRELYQKRYEQPGLTTKMPGLDHLEGLKASSFRGSEKDFREKIAVVKALKPEGRVLDFGCSWGYATFQLREVGYDAVGFEIARPRAMFGRKHLELDIVDEYDLLHRSAPASYDVIFSSHVLEHLPSFDGVFELFRRLLRPQGLLALFVPNCGGAKAREFGVQWGPMTCEWHTMALDSLFFETVLPQHGFSVMTFSEPYDPDEVKVCLLGGQRPRYPDGEELMVLGTKVGELF